MTLDQWLQECDSEWPKGSIGFRVGRRGKVIWQGATFGDGCSGHLVCVYRSVHENGQGFTRTAYYPFDREMFFVYESKVP